MKFKKKSEIIINPQEPSYFMVRKFLFEQMVKNPIAEFMQTRYFLWEEEFRNEIGLNIQNRRTTVDWNFHGLYDVKKLSPDNFKKMGFQEFFLRFKNFIFNEIGTDSELPQIEIELHKLSEPESNFYLIEDLSNDFRHNWTVFDYFISGFKVNKEKNTLTAIEFGLD